MKISPKQYARGLYDSLLGKSDSEVKEVLHTFVSILGRDRVLSREKEITAAFVEIWNSENGEMAASITSAHELAGDSREAVVSYLKNRTGAKSVILTENVDKNLLGGFVLKYESKVLDGSLKTNLADLKASMEK
ncbi:MAG: ATP synthase F1 subunit delta [Candidatus Falkowbacteria bacterium]|nr:ATP synthase F1 subunit delta [Candidatus Falkowbacteria bacterium]